MFSDRFQELYKVVDYLIHADAGFVIIEVNDRISQNKCISFLETELTSKEIVNIDLENKPENIRPDNFIKSSVEECPGTQVFCVLNMSGLAKGEREDEIALLRNFNMGREKLANLDKLLVFFFPSYFVDLILRYALDFYDFAPLRIKIPNPERQFMDRRDYESEFADEKYVLNRVEFLKSRLEGNLDDEERFKVLMDLGDCLGKLYRWDEAIAVFEGAVELAEEVGTKLSVASAVCELLKVARLANNYDYGEKIFNLGILIAEEFDDWSLNVSLRLDFARLKIQNGLFDQGKELLEQVLDILDQNGQKREYLIVAGELARVYKAQGLYDEALKIHEEQLAFYQSTDVRERAISMGDIAHIFEEQARYNDALELHEKRLSLFKEVQDSRLYAMTLRSIARIYLRVGSLEKALEVLSQQQREFERLGDLRNSSVTYYDMALAERSRNNFKLSVQYLQKSEQLSLKIGDMFGVASACVGLGEILFSLGNVEEGRQKLYEAISGFTKIGDNRQAKIVKDYLTEMESRSV